MIDNNEENQTKNNNSTIIIDTALKQTRIIQSFESVSERYYPRYMLNKKYINNQNYDQIILLHSNGIAVICLAPSHDIVKLKKCIFDIDFYGNNKNVNRLDNQVRGKGKKGAQFVDQNSILCTIFCNDTTTYPIRACIKGKIIEMNKRLIKEPSLINEKNLTDGYVAIILPSSSNK